MLLSRDFRKIARENLRGRWFPAIVVGFLGGLLGAVMDVSYSTEIFTQTGTSNTDALDQLKSAPMTMIRLWEICFPISADSGKASVCSSSAA